MKLPTLRWDARMRHVRGKGQILHEAETQNLESDLSASVLHQENIKNT